MHIIEIITLINIHNSYTYIKRNTNRIQTDQAQQQTHQREQQQQRVLVSGGSEDVPQVGR